MIALAAGASLRFAYDAFVVVDSPTQAFHQIHRTTLPLDWAFYFQELSHQVSKLVFIEVIADAIRLHTRRCGGFCGVFLFADKNTVISRVGEVHAGILLSPCSAPSKSP